jgi:transcriptional regulator with PAS, ATPase and Fis domain
VTPPRVGKPAGRSSLHAEPMRESAARHDGPDPIEHCLIFESAGMRRAVELAQRLAPTMLPIFLAGETGTGKEVLARAIHRWSGRARGLVAFDCGSLPPEMLPARLFGHRRGAFTSAVESVSGLFEQADGGSLFLDELGSLSIASQGPLLRVVEDGEVWRLGDASPRHVSVRLIAAAQEDPVTLVETGRLRRDLQHRLTGGVIYLEPIRERPEDLEALAHHFALSGGRVLGAGALAALRRHDWPGNARELRHVIRRAMALQAIGPLQGGTLLEAILLGRSGRRPDRDDGHLAGVLLERARLEEVCRRHAGVAQLIMAELGLARATLYRRLEEYGLSLRDFRLPGRTARCLTKP